MMGVEDRGLLPEGIEEILPPGARRLEQLRRRLLDLYDRWGYELVIPPFIEFLETLLTGVGNDLNLRTFKLTDQSSGRLMGVRADMTPQVARIDALHLRRDAPTRLCYLGTVLHTRGDGFGGSRSPMQVGAELYGHSGYESDLEILLLMLETLAAAGLRDIHLDLGHVAVFRGLVQQADVDSERESLLFEALQRKAIPEIRQLTAGLPTITRGMFLALADLNGAEDILETAERWLEPAAQPVRQALANLRQIAAAVRRRAPAIPLTFDLAELRGYRYHTGVVFSAYAPGQGQAVAKGGRYDEIARVFGRSRPATGFSADLRTLLAMNAEATTVPAIYAPWLDDPALQARIEALRDQGERVIQALPGADPGARALGCDRLLQRRHDTWVVTALD